MKKTVYFMFLLDYDFAVLIHGVRLNQESRRRRGSLAAIWGAPLVRLFSWHGLLIEKRLQAPR
ncbi:MAG: hypothetical protein R3E83_03880 [Burkholderiaceae bacterium]